MQPPQPQQQPLWLHQLRRVVLNSPDGLLHFTALDTAWTALYGTPFTQATGWTAAAALNHACAAGVLAPAHALQRPDLLTATVTSQHVEQLVQLAVGQQSNANQHVTFEAVLHELDVWLAHRSLASLGLPPVEQTPCLVALRQRLARIHNTVTAFFAVHCIRTYHDLQQQLCQQEHVASYDNLGLGPLHAHPLVAASFVWGPRNQPRSVPQVRMRALVVALLDTHTYH
jgi:hypothetical protein